MPVPWASPPEEVLELDELVVLLELLLELELLLDELLLDGSAALVLVEDEELVLAVCVPLLLEELEEDDSGAELVDELLVLAVCVPLLDVEEDDSGAEVAEALLVLDGCELAVDVVLLELDDVSAGAVLAVVAVPVVVVAVLVLLEAGALLTVVVGADEVAVGVEAIVIGALTGALSDVEKATVDGATVVELLVVVLLVVVVLVLCVAVCTAAWPAVTAVCTVGFETGLPMIVELNVPSVVAGATTVVGTLGPVSVQLVAAPASVSELTATCSPLTGVLLESVAVEALTGPPAAMVLAVSARLPVPASMVPGVSVPKVVSVIPPLPVAVTVPAKLLLRLASVMVLLPAWRFVVPLTAIGPVCVMLPVLVTDRLPAELAASTTGALSTSTTDPVVFTATVPKFVVPCVSEMTPPLFAVNEALPPTVRTSVG